MKPTWNQRKMVKQHRNRLNYQLTKFFLSHDNINIYLIGKDKKKMAIKHFTQNCASVNWYEVGYFPAAFNSRSIWHRAQLPKHIATSASLHSDPWMFPSYLTLALRAKGATFPQQQGKRYPSSNRLEMLQRRIQGQRAPKRQPETSSQQENKPLPQSLVFGWAPEFGPGWIVATWVMLWLNTKTSK